MRNLLLFCFLSFTIFTVAQPITGTRIIGAQGDYLSLSQALIDVKVKGINGNVYLKIKSGSYDEKPIAFHFSKTNNNDTLFVFPESGKKGDVTYKSTIGSNTNNFVLRIDSAADIVFSNLIFESTSSTYGGVIQFKNGSKELLFDKCDFKTIDISGSNPNCNVVYADNGAYLKDVYFNECNFSGGQSSIEFSLNANLSSSNIQIKKCSFSLFENDAILCNKIKGIKIEECIATCGNSNNNGFVLTGFDSTSVIANNKIGGIGDWLINITNYAGSNGDSLLIYNNMARSNSGNVINIANSFRTLVFHNTFYTASSLSYVGQFTSLNTLYVANNIFINQSSGFAVNYNTINLYVLKNNVYYGLGSNSVKFDANTYASASAFSAKETNSIFTDPKILNSTTCKLSCQTPLTVKSATFLPNSFLATDAGGDTRDTQNPWCGYDEFRADDGSQDINVNGYVHNGTDTLKHGKVHMYADKTNNKMLDLIATATINNGAYNFTNVKGFPFLLKVEPDKQLAPNYIDCYYDGKTNWQNVNLKKSESCNLDWNILPNKLASMSSGTNTIKGTILMDVTGKTTNPIPGLDVVLDKIPPGQTVAVTQTNPNGEYTFANLPTGTFQVLVDYPGLGFEKVNEVKFDKEGMTASQMDYCVDTTSIINDCNGATYVQSDYEINHVKIYPNPTTNELYIDLKDVQNGQIEIMDLNGRVMFKRDLKSSTISINTSDWKKGIYLLTIKSNETIWVQKIIKH